MYDSYRKSADATHKVCSFGHTLARLSLYNTYYYFYLYDPVKFSYFKQYLEKIYENKENICGGNLP